MPKGVLVQRNGKHILRNGKLEELAHVLGESDHLRYRGAVLATGEVNVLPQPRKTFEDIPELALDVASKGLLNPPTVARLSEGDAGNYLRVINALWDTEFQVCDLVPSFTKGRKYFHILLAGERRFRSCRLLWQEGCKKCIEKFGPEPPGTCFKRHFRSGKIEVRLCLDVQPLSALYLQLSENTHMRVPPEQEAYAYTQLFKLVRRANADFTLTGFAEKVGRSPDTIRNALQFCELPLLVREAVENGDIPYGIALELVRIYHRKAKDSGVEEELRWWIVRAMTERSKRADFRDSVSRYLESLDSVQGDLWQFMDDAQVAEARRLHIRQTVQVHCLRAIWGYIGYFEGIQKLFEQGLLGEKDSPFSEGSPRRILQKHVAQLRTMTPHLHRLLPKRDRARTDRTLRSAERALSRFQE